MIPHKEKLKVISYSNVFNIVARGSGGFDFLRRQVEGNILFNKVAKGGGGFDFLWRQVEGNIRFNKVFRGGGLIPYKRKLKVISH